MKNLVVFLVFIFWVVPVFGGEGPQAPRIPQIPACPRTTMATDCLQCHVRGNFGVRETAPDAQLVYPFTGMRVILEGGIPKGYYLLGEIESTEIRQFFEYLDGHGIKVAVIEIHSPGGALFSALRIVGLIRNWQKSGGKVEMRLYGMAFSAGFYIFTAGDVRLVDEYASLMWHEIQSFGGFGVKVETPSDKEDEAKILRGLQDVSHAYLATRGKLSKKEIDQRVAKRQEWWMTGAEAVKFGFADGFLGK